NEIRSRAAEKRLRAVLEITSGQFLIPNVGKENMRQYRGWDAAGSAPPLHTNAKPGPTFRTRLGDQVQIAFLNKADERLIPDSLVTKSAPRKSSFGCDTSGVPDASGRFPYPASDKFPNCFHGSSTANIHFHGTHTNPDGLGDNVLVQVLPDPGQPDWTATFNQ